MEQTEQTHVVRLLYELVPLAGRSTLVVETQILEGRSGDFEWSLGLHPSGFFLVARPTCSIESAQEAQESFERAIGGPLAYWELQTGAVLRLRHVETETQAHGEPRQSSKWTRTRDSPASAALAVTAEAQPTVPPDWAQHEPPHVQDMRERWRSRQSRFGLIASAQYCLTVLEKHYGKRGHAAAILMVEPGVLSTLGWLGETTDKGNARKAKGHGPETLSQAHKRWILATVPELILRAWQEAMGCLGEDRLAFNDLPPLPDRSRPRSSDT